MVDDLCKPRIVLQVLMQTRLEAKNPTGIPMPSGTTMF